MSDSYIYEVEQLQAKSRLRDEQKDAEIERLRKALASSCDEQRQLYREEANLPCEAAVEAQVLKDEIERLRGLLHGAVRIDEGDFSVNVDEWMRRVREALGDG